jgi:HPr kinase/phosphorylase
MHGVLIEVYGEGILMLGESGVGKSETALEIVKRGHRLIADDLVEVRRVSEATLLGRAPEIIRHLIEIRGLGILDVKELYGVSSVKMQENIHFVINLELWDEKKVYDRLGLKEEVTTILGINVPSITIPVRPGRNLAVIVEVAAINFRQKSMGYNAARALTDRVFKQA